MEFSEQIRKIRQGAGLTQEEFAQKLHVTRQAVSNWETGKNYPDMDVLIRIHDEFQVSLDQLILGGDEKMTQKVIDDSRESTRTKKRNKAYLIGAALMGMGILAILIRIAIPDTIGPDGILHEQFALLGGGYLCLAAGFVVILCAAIVSAVKKRKSA